MASRTRRDADFQPELRKNLVTREWVIIAKGRGKRPSDFAGAAGEEERVPSHDEKCPFCTGNEGKTPSEVFALRERGGPNSGGWTVRVVPNKFAALRAEGSSEVRQEGLYSARDGLGAHEVVVETPDHSKDLWEMEVAQIESVIEAYRQRLLAFESGEILHHVLLFRNHGPKAGTSLVHPHSQLIAAPVMPHQLQVELQGAAAYWEYLGRCVFCALIENDVASGERVVLDTEHFVVVAAYAGRYPFETWIVPKRHAIGFAAMSEAEASDLAHVLRETLGRLADCLGRPSYNFAIHTARAAEHNIRAYHWHMEIFPRVTTLGGFELGSDIYINVVAPEDAARYLREAQVPTAALVT
jgi:UDPglucose--hexose-1-phosphate uridylyltransferase